jgi:serine/threonine protein kinase
MEVIAPEVQVGDYMLIKQIGMGEFASVWAACHVITNVKVAIKIIARTALQGPDAVTRFAREIAFLKQMNHPFIAQLFETFDSTSSHFVVLEFAENGNLFDFVNKKGALPENQARHYFCQLLSVLEYLHFEKLVAHRDLKAENILLDHFNNIRVIDFGLSSTFSSVHPQLSTRCGSPAYAPPEMIKGQPYTTAADIWSSGVLLYAMCAGVLPYDDASPERLLQKIAYTDIVYPELMSPPLVDLLRKMLSKNPDTRIRIDKIKEHPWFSQSEYGALMNMPFRKQESTAMAIDKEIVDQMSAMGLDCHPLHQQLLSNEYTPLSGIYRSLLRAKMTEQLNQLVPAGQCMSSATPQNDIKFFFAPLTGGSHVKQPQPSVKTTTARPKISSLRPPIAKTASPLAIPGGNQPKLLQAPAPVQIAARRGSRPVAARRMDVPHKFTGPMESP